MKIHLLFAIGTVILIASLLVFLQVLGFNEIEERERRSKTPRDDPPPKS